MRKRGDVFCSAGSYSRSLQVPLFVVACGDEDGGVELLRFRVEADGTLVGEVGQAALGQLLGAIVVYLEFCRPGSFQFVLLDLYKYLHKTVVCMPKWYTLADNLPNLSIFYSKTV